MAPFDPRELFTRLLTALQARDVATLRELIQPDVVSNSPQSGERSVGFEAFLLEGDSYPGGSPEVEIPNSRILVDDDRWVITPAYTVVPMASPSTYTVVMKVRYPDGANWYSVMLVELRHDKVASVEAYYAPELPAPLLGTIEARTRG